MGDPNLSGVEGVRALFFGTVLEMLCCIVTSKVTNQLTWKIVTNRAKIIPSMNSDACTQKIYCQQNGTIKNNS